jgi:hypothetical protein
MAEAKCFAESVLGVATLDPRGVNLVWASYLQTPLALH